MKSAGYWENWDYRQILQLAASSHARHMIPAGGLLLSSQTSLHLLLQEGPARAAGFKAQENGTEVWDCPPRRLQKAQARGQGGAGIMSMCHQEPEAPHLPKVSKVN